MISTEPKNLERQKSTEKTEAIIQGAMQEFLAHGYAATSMDRVAKAAGVSKATVYSHFGDKEGLFNALIKILAKDKFKTVMALQESPSLEKDPQLFLQQLGTQLLENSRSDRAFHNFIRIIIGESGRFPELAKAYVNNLARPGIEILTKYFKSHPELNLPDEEATVRVFIGTLVYYLMLQELLHGKDILPLESDRLVNTLTHLITVAKD
ncbi:MAG: TetR/AcrR family transcriptional regulator [Xenococcaceae cyanobacterium]